MKKFSFLLALLFVITAFSGCGPASKRYSKTYLDVFDTVCELTAYCASEAVFEEAAEQVHAELIRLHTLFDIYAEDRSAGVACLNDNAGTAVSVDADLYALLTLGKEMAEKTGGKLNIAMGAVLSLWHEAREEGGTLPDPESLQKASGHCDIEKMILENGSVLLADTEMSLDLGAVAKGYAADCAAETAVKAGLTDFMLNLGGNVVTRGKKPGGSWVIGVQNPEGGGYSATLSVSDMSIVTSGDYQRFYTVDGINYCHIIDPETLYPAVYYHSVTVLHTSSAAADALSTALFCMTREEGTALLEEVGGEALWIDADGTVYKTEGFSAYEK